MEEYYLYDPASHHLEIYRRQGAHLRLVLSPKTLEIHHPDGQSFLSSVELARLKEIAEARAERLAERLRALGIDPDDAGELPQKF